MKTLIFVIGIPFIPFFWLGFIPFGDSYSLIQMYKDYWSYYKSDESFGLFD